MQGVVNEEIFQVFNNKTKQEENLASIPEQLENYIQTQIVEPTRAYYGESLEQHLSGLTPNISEVRYHLQHSFWPSQTAAAHLPRRHWLCSGLKHPKDNFMAELPLCGMCQTAQGCISYRAMAASFLMQAKLVACRLRLHACSVRA